MVSFLDGRCWCDSVDVDGSDEICGPTGLVLSFKSVLLSVELADFIGFFNTLIGFTFFSGSNQFSG